MPRNFQMIGAVLGFLAVAAGAFGAHGLKSILEPDKLAVFEVGARYQMYHALALLLIRKDLLISPQSGIFKLAGWAFVIGVLLFSGSLYLYALTDIPLFAMITPVGGVSFLIGWFLLAIGLMKRYR